MADSNIVDLTALAAASGDDLLYIVDDPGGTPLDRKITISNLFTSPSLTTPSLGVATATSINGLTITSSTGVLTITNAKTLAVTHTLTLSGTDGTVMTFPTTSSTLAANTLGNLASVAINTSLATAAGVVFAASSTAPAAANGASQAGKALTLNASNAVASLDTAGAAAGGAITLTSGNAARNTSGNANGGDISLTPGSGIGSGTIGAINFSTNMVYRPSAQVLAKTSGDGIYLSDALSSSSYEGRWWRGELAGNSGFMINWSNNSSSADSTKDTGMARNSAGIWECNNGTPGSGGAALIRGAGAVNGQALKINSTHELLVLSTSGATTDTSANLLPANAIILSVTIRITVSIAGVNSTALQWGDGTVATRFGTTATLTANHTAVGLNHMQGGVAADNAGPVQVAAAPVRITLAGGADNTPSAGTVRITVHYIDLTAPTS